MASSTLLLTDAYRVATMKKQLDLSADSIKVVLGALSGGVSQMNLARNRGGYTIGETGELPTANGYTQGGIVVAGQTVAAAGTTGVDLRAVFSFNTVTLSITGIGITIGGILLVDASYTAGAGSPNGLVIGTLDCSNGGVGIVCAAGTTFRFVVPTGDQNSGLVRH